MIPFFNVPFGGRLRRYISRTVQDGYLTRSATVLTDILLRLPGCEGIYPDVPYVVGTRVTDCRARRRDRHRQGAGCIGAKSPQPTEAARVYMLGAQISFPHGMSAPDVKSSDAGRCEGLITSGVQYCNPTKSLGSDACVRFHTRDAEVVLRFDGESKSPKVSVLILTLALAMRKSV